MRFTISRSLSPTPSNLSLPPAGFSQTLDEQLKQVLDVIALALKRINTTRIAKADAIRTMNEERIIHQQDEAFRREKIRRGTWHDARMDSVVGNDFMSDSGLTDEDYWEEGEEFNAALALPAAPAVANGNTEEDLSDPYENLPIVVLKNYDAKGAAKREDVLNALANWSGALIENQVCLLLIVLSGHRADYSHM